MKVVAFNGSPRKDGNTSILIQHVFQALEKEGIDTEMVQVGGSKIHACMACYQCVKNQDKHCTVKTDILNACIDKILTADGIILGSPSYFANVTAEMKAFIDRVGLVSIVNGHMLKYKVGAAVVAERRGGATNVFDAINKMFFLNQMILPASVYWNFGIGREVGEVLNDQEGLNTMKILGENMAWVLKKINNE